MRGHNVKAIYCDNLSKIYSKASINDNLSIEEHSSRFKKYINRCKIKLRIIGIKSSALSKYIRPNELKEAYLISRNISYEELDSFFYKGFKLGTSIKGSLTRFLKGEEYNIQYSEFLKNFLLKQL